MSIRWLVVTALALILGACEGEEVGRPCGSDDDCTLPELCDSSGTCSAPDPADEGKPCSHDDHCSTGLCLDLGQGASCVTRCKDPSGCQAGQVCAPVVDKSKQLTLLCRARGKGELFLNETCESDAGCTSSLCEGSRCTQPCADSCPGDLVCAKTALTRAGSSVNTGLCRERLSEVLELGAVDVAKSGPTQVSFKVGAGVDAFILFADDKDDLRVAITKLEAPDGTLLVSYAEPDKALMKAWDYFGTAAVHVPGTDDAKGAVQAGTYKAWIQTHEKRWDKLAPVAGKVERVAVIHRRSRQTGGLLDLELHLAPVLGIKAATAKDDPYVKGTLQVLESQYRRLAGISLGQITYHDLDKSADAMADADAVRALRVSRSVPGPNKLSVNLFFVQKITFGYEALAGGLPGVPGLAKRPMSGIVIQKQASVTRAGQLIAHEVGHFLGLWHPTECGSTMTCSASDYDKISDTPKCAAGTKVQSCPDFKNLMFPHHLLSSTTTLSSGQVGVLRGTPFLYERVYPEACGADSAVVDVSTSGFGSGTTAGLSSALEGSCGGASAGERVHLYRLKTSGLKSLDLSATSKDFDPVLYVLQGSCEAKTAQQVACATGAKSTALKLTVPSPATGAYFVVVDSKSGGGSYSLTVTEVAK